MAEVNVDSSKKKGGGKAKPKKLSTRIDLTPMVDLGFLLITFFMLATSLIKPQTMEIAMPSRKKLKTDVEDKIKQSRAITIILGKDNKVFYYSGTKIDNVDPEVLTTDYSAGGMRKFLLDRNRDVMIRIAELEQEKALTDMPEKEFEEKASVIRADTIYNRAPIVIIKPSDDASYKNLIDILDEMHICNIGKYAIVDISPYDLELIKDKNL